jgi:hypothetical protein
VLPAGLARAHHGNPAAALRIEQSYGLPVLLSGLASLVLNKSEEETLDLQHKQTLERLQRLYPRTPAPVVYLLAGTLPASARRHLSQLGLLGMLARLGPDSILHRLGRELLANPDAKASWFHQVRGWCQQYGLPDPLYVLANPPRKGEWSAAARLRVLDYWNQKLRAHAESLPSLSLLRAGHMSLARPSAIWTSCGSDQYEVRKATVQARMLSGRYRTCWLRRHWSGDTSGVCRVPGCTGDSPGTLLHLATGQCPGLAAATSAAARHWAEFLLLHPEILPLILELLHAEPGEFLAFLLDPSTHPAVVVLSQQQGNGVVDKLCFLSRSWLYRLHRERFKLLGLSVAAL